MRSLAIFHRSQGGNVAIVFGLSIVALLGFAAFGIELARANKAKSTIQNAGDAAALAGARELSMAGSDPAVIANIASGSVKSYIAANVDKRTMVTSATEINKSPLEVKVKVSTDIDLPFGAVFGIPKLNLTTTSVARVVGQPNLCVLGLDPAAPGTIALGSVARVTGRNCSVFSDSRSPTGIVSDGGILNATTICSAGGIGGSPSSFEPRAMTDCPTFKDPLSDRAAPDAGACTYNGKKISGEAVTLSPGVYCGGLVIGNQSDVTLAPGIYVIRDGGLEVGTFSTLRGTGVGIYFQGVGGNFRFKTESNVELRAPTSGPMAGILFFGDRSQPATTTYVINSDNARVLVGTIYLPAATLQIDASKTVGDLSEYTAIVARVVEFRKGNVVLNTDYGLTDVPVPPAIRGAGQPIALAH